ncbi:hypothetical protein O181_035501 [Austropuccinia psidii MF-1]|uniref:Uncharacterized protein n=1 Tax=Austropuccinia psidii MF-1 TaxID=1389203 RepID=A0A9Q3D8E3_9BASI|nr:hypothetical protein [Austropuccinia psidii MF-1]
MGPLGPFWPKSNEAKRGQGGSPSAPKSRWIPNHKWAHLSQLWPQNPINPKWPKTTLGPKLAINQLMASGNHQRPPAQLKTRILLQFKGRLLLLQCTPYSRIQEWCIYGIIYHYAPVFTQKSNGEVFRTKLSDSKSSPQSITIFEGGRFSYSVWKFPASYQKTIQGPQPPGPTGVGLSISIRTILGAILRGNQSFKSLPRPQVFRIPRTTQLVHTGSNQASCMALAQLGRSIFCCGNSVPQFNSQDGQSYIGPIQTIQPGDSPSSISLSAFHIYWPPFITWGIFPQLINIFNLLLCLFSFSLLK